MSSSPDTRPRFECADCGAVIYQEHINRHLAGRWAGRLLCPHCLTQKQEEDRSGAAAFSGEGAELEQKDYHRPLNKTGQGATRVRIFHTKLADGPVRVLNQQVNDWLETHPEIEIKFANTTVGTWEGKHAEPNLILTLFY